MRIALLFMLACNGNTPDTGDTDPPDPPTAACEGIPEGACGEIADCAIVLGTPCGGSIQFAGCTEAPGGALTCADVESGGEPPDEPGDCWLFSDSCVPDGWASCDPECL